MIKLLLDQGLPRSTTRHLGHLAIETIHVGDIGLATADDARILAHAREQGRVLVTLDADFHRQLALANMSTPSVIRVRIEGLRGEALAALLVRVIERCRDDLERGALVSVTDRGLRLRKLPLGG